MREILVIPTERPDIVLRQLAGPADDIAYCNAVNESPQHVDIHNNSVAARCASPLDAMNMRQNAGDDLLMGIRGNDGSFKGALNGRPNQDKTEIEIDGWLRASAVRNGIATASLRAFSYYLSAHYDRLFAKVHVENTACIQALRRSFYTQSGEVDDGWGPAYVFNYRKKETKQ